MTIITNINVLLESLQFNDKLYHYSLKKFPHLLTLEEQWKSGISLNKKDSIMSFNKNYQQKYGIPYYQHISFLFDPLPIDIIKKSFKDSNNELYRSNSCYEYIIDVDQLKNMYYFMVVENPINNFFYNYLWPDFNFPGKYELYFKTNSLLNKIVGNKGDTFNSLKLAISRYKGKTKSGFKYLVNHKEFEDIKKDGKYAPFVPYLMAFIKPGIVNYSSVKKILI